MQTARAFSVAAACMAWLLVLPCVRVVAAPPRDVSLPRPESIPMLDPATDLDSASPGVVYQAVAATKGLDAQGLREGGAALRYTYVLPEGFSTEESRNLVVILHGFGVDFRWGHAQLPPGTFRTRDITVSVDGTSLAEDGTRVFNPRNADAVVLRDFILEASRVFPTNRIVLVGYRQGGRFAVVFASAFPRLIDGVVAVASGLYEAAPAEGAVQALPLVFIHGVADDQTPYPLSLDAVHTLCAARHPMAMLRRLPGVADAPSAERIGPCVDWVMAMMTPDPALALQTARELLKPDQTGAQDGAPPAFHMARAIVRRFEVAAAASRNREPGVGIIYPFDEQPPEDLRKQAWDLMIVIEAHAQEHVRALKASGIASRADLEGPHVPAMLGHLLALREDMRGIDSVEAYVRSLEFDRMWHAHFEAGEAIWHARNADDLTPAEALTRFVDGLPKAFLYDGLPLDLYSMIEQLKARTGPGAPAPDVVARCAWVDEYYAAMERGEKAYRALRMTFKP